MLIKYFFKILRFRDLMLAKLFTVSIVVTYKYLMVGSIQCKQYNNMHTTCCTKENRGRKRHL